ncbi:hypothetical protein HHL22_07195 [Hymenobacter sp. RP-2-7]|uniref:Uncharacterized protein n=1 Tax=Hymenobacter polaris TaxID=2682546 RepID=A0A7Y0ACW1_9BACT|nr:hypothetical protein [Hymenobacter polaris]NML64989.1 hypothetical protein [Hymenobacter polaris]
MLSDSSGDKRLVTRTLDDTEGASATPLPPRTQTRTVLALLLLVALGAVGYGLRDHHRDDALLSSPRAGDIYTVHAGRSGTYSLLKVLRAGGNGVELVANEYQTTDSKPIAVLNQAARYSQEPFVITRLDLQIMRRRGELTDVDRP